MRVIINMDEAPYSNRQIENMLAGHTEEIKSYIDLKTNPILVQTQKTNGRVNTQEVEIAKQKTWRLALAWVGAVVVFAIVVIGIPVIGNEYSQIESNKEQLDKIEGSLKLLNSSQSLQIKQAVNDAIDERVNKVTQP